MDTKDIDRTHIVALQEVNGMLQFVEQPIEKPEQFIAELKAMVDNPNRTVWDMQSHFKPRFPMNTGFHDYLYPYSYSSSYVGGIQYPAKFEYTKLKQSWEKAAQEAQDEYTSRCKRANTVANASEIKRLREEAIANIKHCQKSSFLQDAIRWIDASGYAKEASKMKRNNSVKMFSKENVGWNTFSHKVNEDIVVELRTNFGYGSAAYFLLGVKYKGLAILPYSYIVKYYNARMADIIRCTRSYIPSRESWCAAFDFISDFVNQAMADPEKFVKTYIMEEVKEMMSGLEAISIHPKEYMDRIGDRKADPCVINVRPMLSDDHERMASYPEESPIIFKVEKITGALKFLDSLTEIANVVNDVQPHIDRLLELNMELYPEIADAVSKINVKIETQTALKADLERQISSLSEQLKPFEDEIEKLRAKLTYPNFFNTTNYEATHPEYKKLKDKKNELQSESNKTYRLINDLKSFVGYLNDSIKLLDKMKQAA